MCTLGLTNDLIDGGQPRAKPHLRKAKPNHVLRAVFSPQLQAHRLSSCWLTQEYTLDLVYKLCLNNRSHVSRMETILTIIHSGKAVYNILGLFNPYTVDLYHG